MMHLGSSILLYWVASFFIFFQNSYSIFHPLVKIGDAKAYAELSIRQIGNGSEIAGVLRVFWGYSPSFIVIFFGFFLFFMFLDIIINSSNPFFKTAVMAIMKDEIEKDPRKVEKP